MPIEVHCPNPACARVHRVKNKYAGTRGKCPACQSWMYVPKTGLMPSVASIELPPLAPAVAPLVAAAVAAPVAPPPKPVPALDESPPWSRETMLAPPVRASAPPTLVAGPPAIEEEEEAPIFEEPPPRAHPLKPPVEEEEVIEVGADVVVEEEEVVLEPGAEVVIEEPDAEVVVEEPLDEEPPDKGPLRAAPPPRTPKRPAVVVEEEDEAAFEEEKPKKKPGGGRHFSWLAVVFLLLANLGLGAFVAAPWVPGPSLTKDGDFATMVEPKGISSDSVPVVAFAAGLVGLCAVTSLLLALVSRRMGAATLIPLYLAAFGSAALLLLALASFQRDRDNYTKVARMIDSRKEKGDKGTADVSFGLQHYALVGGAATASVGLLLAGLFMHRRLWGKLLGFVLLSFLPALAVAWVYRKEFGLEQLDLPFSLPM
jgi:hypothetical protein